MGVKGAKGTRTVGSEEEKRTWKREVREGGGREEDGKDRVEGAGVSTRRRPRPRSRQ